ncbi:CFI-box-CTERM domain-containing protein [Salinibacter ruber]|uniref:CFI-box-CTERM domain-containing protein n=1 Tax=Salinibacter ruber TaxID=146919 RepID=UPI0020741F7E|nr:CFI-box-CTERM domain-containing protein [Salinibacter ruber]
MSDNIRELADTSYKSESYDEAYDYYSRLLEDNPDDGEAWARKGVSAAWRSSLDDDRFKELYVSLEKADEKGFDIEDADISGRIVGAAEDYIDEIYAFFDEKIENKRKEAMGTGTLESVKRESVKTEGFVQGGNLASEWLKAFKAMNYACELQPSAERCRKSIREIDKLRAHSEDFKDYLTNNDDAAGIRKEIMSIREELLEMARDIDAEFRPDKVEMGGGTSSGGCYIATATVGHQRHPILFTLRRFRDEHLLTNPLGRAFVSTYYATAPYLARVIEKSELLRGLSMRLVVKPLYHFASRLDSGR